MLVYYYYHMGAIDGQSIKTWSEAMFRAALAPIYNLKLGRTVGADSNLIITILAML